MNREIKFRLFDKVNKNMVYPSEKIYINMFGKIVLEDIYDGEIIEANTDEYVLMQYTGLKDIKGNEIYEGDIVKITGNYKPGIYTVIWDSYRVAWWLKNVKKREREYDDDFYQLLDNPFQEREVIGNIYENPEAANGR